MSFKHIYYILFLLIVISSCKKDEPQPSETINQPPLTIACDENKLPIVMLHGLLASGDTYGNFFQLFEANGYCENTLYVMDRNSLDFSADFSPALDAFIDDVITKTGAEKVNLMGHSAGGGVAYAYLADSLSAQKVAHYAHLASFTEMEPPLPNKNIPTINIYSDADKIVPGKDIPGATNVNLIVADHYQVATSTEAFKFIYNFFNNGENPLNFAPVKKESIELKGRVVTLGENQPIEAASISIYELNANTGIRTSNVPAIKTSSDEQGNWDNVIVKPNVAYEFFVENPSDENFTPVHYYFESFSSNNSLVYLRTIPPAGSAAGIFLAAIPKDDTQAVTAIFASTQAIINGRDELFIDDIELSTAALSSEEQSTIAMFLYDDMDEQSSGKSHPGFLANTPFLNAVDVFMEPTDGKFSTITFNGDKLSIPHWPSKSNGYSIVVFD